MKNHPLLIQQKLYKPENYQSIQQMVTQQRMSTTRSKKQPVTNLMKTSFVYPQPQYKLEISNATPINRNKLLYNQSNTSYNLSETHHKLESTELSHLSTFFTSQHQQCSSKSKEAQDYSNIHSTKFSWDALEINPKEAKRQHIPISIDLSSQKKEIQETTESNVEGFQPLNKDFRMQKTKKPQIMLRNNIKVDVFLQNFKTTQQLLQINSSHLGTNDTKMNDSKVLDSKTNKSNTVLTNMTNTYLKTNKMSSSYQHKTQKHLNSSLHENPTQNEQQTLMDIIKQDLESRRKLKPAEDEYSYRKQKSTTNASQGGIMNFFESINTTTNNIDSIKSRSRSVQHSQISVKLKDLIDQAMENTQDFNFFIGSISTKNKRK